MKKYLSLLKAMFSNDMNILRKQKDNNSKKIKSVISSIILTLILMGSLGLYMFAIAEPLSHIGQTHIIISYAIIMVTIFAIMQGVYKAPALLYECKDNDLLMALPIKKSWIYSARIIKVLVYQFLYNLLFITPAVVLYIVLEKPPVSFYPITLLMIIMLPIIPTIISTILGYISTKISNKLNKNKFIKIITSLIFTILIIALFQLGGNSNYLVENSAQINDVIMQKYYPAGLYINLITNFHIMDLVKYIAINILPLIAVIYLGSINYFNIISKESERITTKKKENKKEASKKKTELQVRTPYKALLKKEFKTFTDSTPYVLNTLFGLILLVIISLIILINKDIVLEAFNKQDMMKEDVIENFSLIFVNLMIFTAGVTAVSASSISMEGKAINITKTLPVSEKIILKAKLMNSVISEGTLLLISTILVSIGMKLNIVDAIILIVFSILIPLVFSLYGLLLNLKYSKLKFENDIEVIKQSKPAFIMSVTGMLAFGATSILSIMGHTKPLLVMLAGLIIFGLIALVLYKMLMTKGVKRLKNIYYE